MIISTNPKPTIDEFRKLMKRTDSLLNEDAKSRPEYYATRSGNPLEDDVKNALDESSKGTAFYGTIEKISGQHFPDIIASKYYGVEVKSTKEDHWTSTGSSILETTRDKNVERIYMTFGKLGGTPAFLSKPYEECLYGIAVTHMPRYLIDMRLKQEETIFAKMRIPYDTLRKMENPIEPVANYYRSKLKPGESLWWTGSTADEAVSVKTRLWRNLDIEEKNACVVYGLLHFPEIFRGSYDNYALWLTSQGVVAPSLRDQFSAGGQEEMVLSTGEKKQFPGVYRRVKERKEMIRDSLMLSDDETIIEKEDNTGFEKRVIAWAEKVSKESKVDYAISMDALTTLFLGSKNVH